MLPCITTFCCSEAVNVGYVDVGYNNDLLFLKIIEVHSSVLQYTVL